MACGIRRDTRGYTLLEMMAVLVIVGIMAGIAAPRIASGFRGANLKTSAKQFASALRAARSIAVSERMVVTTAIQMDGGSYRFQKRDLKAPSAPDTGGGEAVESDESAAEMFLPEIFRREFKLPEDIYFLEFRVTNDRVIDMDTVFIEFYPKGNSTGGTVIIGVENGPAYAVTVDRVTGRVYLEAAV